MPPDDVRHAYRQLILTGLWEIGRCDIGALVVQHVPPVPGWVQWHHRLVRSEVEWLVDAGLVNRVHQGRIILSLAHHGPNPPAARADAMIDRALRAGREVTLCRDAMAVTHLNAALRSHSRAEQVTITITPADFRAEPYAFWITVTRA